LREAKIAERETTFKGTEDVMAEVLAKIHALIGNSNL